MLIRFLYAIQGASNTANGSSPAKKDHNASQLTPLERHLTDAGPLRTDGSDKFFGMENVSDSLVIGDVDGH